MTVLIIKQILMKVVGIKEAALKLLSNFYEITFFQDRSNLNFLWKHNTFNNLSE